VRRGQRQSEWVFKLSAEVLQQPDAVGHALSKQSRDRLAGRLRSYFAQAFIAGER
jgi:hypothetical protein